jgi:hypothetical protein
MAPEFGYSLVRHCRAFVCQLEWNDDTDRFFLIRRDEPPTVGRDHLQTVANPCPYSLSR